ncbi:uncharacterized protein BX663DRAFT_528432 [Cokeromyces recurvatus]|uniref:uncharacterized protein n=1 Tax=Cokeromyces recurvatus TaxID=90255 RepID=UPI00221EC687|nr:uncharacterized protein BX663DRAFT_528432 [Cokeromyces recurvatus]KAI7907683.1 hypothetical protein BX663DRAFT_528432 [Cokeromyces recurvatus]
MRFRKKKKCYFFFRKDFLPVKSLSQHLNGVALCHKGFDRLLATHFYTQIVRPQLEYGLAISLLSAKDIQQLESCQNTCIRRIFGGSSQSSVKVMLHMVNQPSMKVRVSILQAQFVFQFLEENFQQLREGTRSVLLSACRPNLIIDPILWLPMTHSERSQTIRWRLGWLPGGIPKACPYHPHFYRWPVMCTILQEMGYLMHDKLPPPLLDPGRKLLNWLSL